MGKIGITHSDRIFAFAFIIFAGLVAFVWVPMDSGSGLMVKVRGRHAIGDALAPSMAAAFVFLGAVLLFVESPKNDRNLSLSNIRFVLGLLIRLAISFALMRWSGPFAVVIANWFSGAEMEYRLLRDTAPWKYLGFFLGSNVLVTSLICWVEGRMRLRSVIIGCIAAVALIAIYDLPFDTLVLPPNGDV